MSRSGYSDDCDTWDLIRWRGAVLSALRGRRGQAFLQELLDALDAMPERRLVKGELEEKGEVCALGCVGRARGMDITGIDPYDRETIADKFGIAEAMAAEIMYENDDDMCREITPEDRWKYMRSWVISNLKGKA